MGFFFPGVPPYMLQWAATAMPSGTAAVETGTYLGNSAILLGETFGKCITIERAPELAARATQRFLGDDRVEVRQGSSRDQLGPALETLEKPPFVWLDAHWSGGVTAGSDDPCPVLAEIGIVGDRFAGQAVLLIDDARGFGAKVKDDSVTGAWPPLFEVLAALEGLGWRSFLIDDVVAGVPPVLSASFAALESQSATARAGTLHARRDALRGHVARLRSEAARRVPRARKVSFRGLTDRG